MAITTGKEALIEILKAEGVEYVFGLPGSTEVFFVDALEDHPDIKYILGLHENVAMGMAEGYARASGKAGFVNLHTSTGIGAALPLMINAYAGGVPLVVTAGNQTSSALMQEAPLGEFDLTEMAKQYSKWSAEVSYINDLPLAMRRAFKVAMQPPTGPVFISIPQDLMQQELDFNYIPNEPYFAKMRPDRDALEKAAEILLNAKMPVVAVGAGIARDQAVNDVISFVENIGAPAYQGHMSDLNIPVGHPQYLRQFSPDNLFAKEVSQEQDVLVLVGVPQIHIPQPLRDSNIKIIQIDDKAWEIGKNYTVAVGIQSNIQVALEELNQILEQKMSPEIKTAVDSRIKRVSEEKQRMDKEFSDQAQKEKDKSPIAATKLMGELSDAIKPGTLIVDDSWSCSASLRRCIDLKDPRGYYRFRGGGSIGWGMPGGIGVQLAFPDKPVVVASGDGSAVWSNQSLWTAAAYNLPITYIISANARYQYVRAGKAARMGDDFKKRRMGLEFEAPRISFSTMAESMGVPAKKVDQPDDLQDALKWAVDSNGPSLVEVTIEQID